MTTHSQLDMSGKTNALYQEFKNAIVNGAIPSGAFLPSTRDVALSHKVSRGTVVHIYEMLASEGFVDAQVGSGTRVVFKKSSPSKSQGNTEIRISSWAKNIHASVPKLSNPSNLQIQRSERVSFPESRWKECVHKALRETDILSMPSMDVGGSESLKVAISSHLRKHRGIEASTEEIVITTGSIQGISFLAMILGGRGNNFVIENPSYLGTRSAILASGAKCIPAQVDLQGIVVDSWKANAAIVTPTHQFPTGAVLSLPRRMQLLDWATKHNSMIIEDDYDSEFRRVIHHAEPLRTLSSDRVIYVGSFSPTMFDRLRLGFLILPKSVRDIFLKVKSVFETHSPAWLEQVAMAHFMKQGYYARHLRKAGKEYGLRYESARLAFEKYLPGVFNISTTDAGIHLFAKWNRSRSAFKRFKANCDLQGVTYRTADSMFLQDAYPALLISYGYVSPSQITSQIRRMADCL